MQGVINVRWVFEVELQLEVEVEVRKRWSTFECGMQKNDQSEKRKERQRLRVSGLLEQTQGILQPSLWLLRHAWTEKSEGCPSIKSGLLRQRYARSFLFWASIIWFKKMMEFFSIYSAWFVRPRLSHVMLFRKIICLTQRMYAKQVMRKSLEHHIINSPFSVALAWSENSKVNVVSWCRGTIWFACTRRCQQRQDQQKKCPRCMLKQLWAKQLKMK